MNDLAPRYSLQPMKRTEVATELATLFALMGSQKQDKELEKAINQEYLRVAEDIPDWAMKQAIMNYRDGKIGEGKFVPKPPELAAAARRLVEAEEQRQQQALIRKRDFDALVKQNADHKRREMMRSGITPESKARVAKKLAETQANIAAAQLEVKEPSSNDMLKTQERFAAQARQATIKSLEME